MNFDAAVFENSGCVGIRVAIQDSNGAIIATLSQSIPLPLSVEMVEVVVARRATLFA